MTKRLLMGLILVMTTTAAMAEWTRVDSSDEFILYVDRATIIRNGHLVKMWGLYDLKTVQTGAAGDSYLSDKAQSEYDCKEEKVRTLALIFFSGQMGNGKVVYSDSDTMKWIPVPPGSFGATLWKIACGK